MESYPLISIISTFKDSKTMLKIVMDSVLSQDYPKIEHIITDSASKDGSVELLQQYELKYTEKSKTLIFKSEPDRNIADGINKAAKEISGEYFLMLTNPFVTPGSLSLLMKNLLDNNLDAVCGGAIFHRNGKIIRRWTGTKWSWRLGWMAANETLCMKKNIYDKFGPYSEAFSTSFDYDFQLRVFKDKDIKLKAIQTPIIYFYAGGTSNGSVAENIKTIKDDYTALKANKVTFAWFTMLCKCIAAFLAYTFASGKDISEELPHD